MGQADTATKRRRLGFVLGCAVAIGALRLRDRRRPAVLDGERVPDFLT
jgi:hypothetical protein